MRHPAHAVPFLVLAWALAACSSSSPGTTIANCCDGAAAQADAEHVADAGSHDAADAAGPLPEASSAGDACVTCGRDWAAYPAVATVSGVNELWVVSDIHGDYTAATKLLAAAHVLASVPATPSAAQWGAGTATFVVVGDLIDKGPDAPAVIELIGALQGSAAAAGGQVIVTMGNHEAEFLADPENSKAAGSDGLDPQLHEAGISVDATASGADPIGAFLRNLPFAARVDDWFFVHAGDTNGSTVTELETTLENGVNAAGFGASVLSNAGSLLEAKLNPSPPQWWDSTGNATTLLTTWTTSLGVKHLVMGHQPGAVGLTNGPNRAADQMAAEFGGLLFLIDTGLSVDVDDTGGALLHVTHVNTASEAWEEVLPSGATKTL